MLNKIKEIIQTYKEEQEATPIPSPILPAPELQESRRAEIERKVYGLLDGFTEERTVLTEEMEWDHENEEWICTGNWKPVTYKRALRTKGIFHTILEEGILEGGDGPNELP